jgi:hypothetical protein
MADPVPMWPATLPNPQANDFSVDSPPRVEAAEILFGSTRLVVKAHAAPMRFTFQFWFTPAQMEIFEEFYRDVVENFDGEFYARWIGGSRVVAFDAPYEYVPLGVHYVLTGSAISTRVDPAPCDDFLVGVFGSLYRAKLAALDRYEADIAAADRYVDNFSLTLIAENEC